MENKTTIRHRVAGIIIQNEKILLMRRFRDGKEYYVFPGGGVEENESYEETLKREMQEELSIKIGNSILSFEFEQSPVYYGTPIIEKNHYFLIESFKGMPELGGPERERMNEQNQYHIEWIDMGKIKELDNLYPKEAIEKILENI